MNWMRRRRFSTTLKFACKVTTISLGKITFYRINIHVKKRKHTDNLEESNFRLLNN